MKPRSPELPPSLPEELLSAILSHTKSEYLGGKASSAPWNSKDVRYFARGVERLNEVLALSRGDRRKDYFSDPVMRSGYLCYFLPVNAAKTLKLLERHLPQNLIDADELSVADIGAGPLTMSLALLAAIKARRKSKKPIRIKIIAFEQNAKILIDGETILYDFGKRLRLEGEIQIIKRAAPLSKKIFGRDEFDIVLAGNLINEFSDREEQTQTIGPLLTEHVAANGFVLMIEPGTKTASRDIQALRDVILSESDFAVLGPCLHQDGCPLNRTAKGDWCHQAENWQAPAVVSELDHACGLKKHRLLFSYLALVRGKEHAPRHNFGEFSFISDVMPTKHSGDQIIACGPAGRIRLCLPKAFGRENFMRYRRGGYLSSPKLAEKLSQRMDLPVDELSIELPATPSSRSEPAIRRRDDSTHRRIDKPTQNRGNRSNPRRPS